MKYLRLEIKGFRRFRLKHIMHLIYTPEERIQIILGTNGSGKSSLLYELSPLPAESAFYDTDGYKIVDIAHNNSLYRLKSTILQHNGSAKYSFVKDGEELNPGGTKTVFKNLAEKEFGITPEIHNLRIGNIKFHSMTSAERRSWLMKLSHVDFTYSLKYFQRLKDRLKASQGALKRAQSRLVQESDKLLSPEQENALRVDIRETKDFIDYLLESRSPVNLDVWDQANHHDRFISELLNRIEQKTKSVLPYSWIIAYDDCDRRLSDIAINRAVRNKRITDLYKEIGDLGERLKVLKSVNVKSASEIDKIINDMFESAEDMLKRLRLNVEFQDNVSALEAIYAVSDSVMTIVKELPPNADKRLSRTAYVGLIEDQQRITACLNEENTKHARLVAGKLELEKLAQSEKTECPKCSFQWAIGYDEERYRRVCKELEQTSAVVKNLTESLASITKQVEEQREYLVLYKQFHNFVVNVPALAPAWTYIVDRGIIFDNPSSVTSVLYDLRCDLELKISLAKLYEDIKKKQELKKSITESELQSIEESDIKFERLNREVSLLIKEDNKEAAEEATINTLKSAYEALEQMTEDLHEAVLRRNTYTNQLVDSARAETIGNLIAKLKFELIKKEQLISRVDIQKALVKDLEQESVVLTQEVELLKMAVKEMSPTEGLIAKNITMFINHLVWQINTFLREFWLYPMELVPVTVDSGETLELDYKFAVKVGNDFTIPDISVASAGMQEAIDLSFMIASSNYLGLDDAPIYLDEFGVKLDSAHRESAFRAINSLITSSNFSQIFMISHYEGSYGSIKNADFNVLCDENIVLHKDCIANRVLKIR